MPTLSAPRRKRPKTPIEKAAVPAGEDRKAAAAPPPELEALPVDLRRQREKAFAVCMALRFEKWLRECWLDLPTDYTIAHNSILPRRCRPIDVVYFLPIFVEAAMKAHILFPDLLPVVWVPGEEEDTSATVVTARDARAAGLSFTRKRTGQHRPKPTLPGCPGVDAPCDALRRAGDTFCDECARTIRARLRQRG